MNNSISLAYLILIIAPLFSAYRGSVVKENNASASFVFLRHVAGEKYSIDTKESVVAWKGSSVEGAHTGYVYISKGELMIDNGQLMGGTVEIDMSTIEGEDHRSDNNLINHLKDPDFFDVKKFPISTFAITKVALADGENINVTGNLTIKGITHEVTFPAKMEVKDGIVKANGKLGIDRTLWDVRYNSGKFYDNLADKTISDSIEFHIKIVAKK
ncbi:MAG: YceI family protein [Chryseolinea sp.]